MGDYTLEIIITAMCFLGSFLFSASETALTAASRGRIFSMVQEGMKRASLVLKIRENKDAMISTILLGNTLVNMAAASLVTIICVDYYGPSLGPVYATILLTGGVLLFCEVLPKTLAIHHAERAALALSPFIAFFIRALWPVTQLVQFLVRVMLKPFGVSYGENQLLTDPNEVIRGTIALHHSEGAMLKEDRDMLDSILDLNNREVAEVMLHRKQVIAIDIQNDPEDIVNEVTALSHSRIPIYKETADNIIGLLHVKDLLKLVRSQRIGITREMIRQLAQKPWYVPDTTSLADQLSAFRKRRQHFAFVVDEYGAWQGIVTLEDILEEIVGNIDDEHDALGIGEMIPCGERKYRVAGSTTIRDLNRALEWDLPDDNASTVAGLVMHEARVIPEAGAAFEFLGYRFEIEERKDNQILQIMIEKLAKNEENAKASLGAS